MDGPILDHRLGNSIVLRFTNRILVVMADKKTKQILASFLLLITGSISFTNGFPNTAIASILMALALALCATVKISNKWGLSLICVTLAGTVLCLLYFAAQHDWTSLLVCIVPISMLLDTIVRYFRKHKSE